MALSLLIRFDYGAGPDSCDCKPLSQPSAYAPPPILGHPGQRGGVGGVQVTIKLITVSS